MSAYLAARHVLAALPDRLAGPDDFDDDGQRIAFDRIFDRLSSASTGERVLVDVALAIWSGGGSQTFEGMLRNLDDSSLARVVEALAMVRPRCRIHVLTEDDQATIHGALELHAEGFGEAASDMRSIPDREGEALRLEEAGRLVEALAQRFAIEAVV